MAYSRVTVACMQVEKGLKAVGTRPGGRIAQATRGRFAHSTSRCRRVSDAARPEAEEAVRRRPHQTGRTRVPGQPLTSKTDLNSKMPYGANDEKSYSAVLNVRPTRSLWML